MEIKRIEYFKSRLLEERKKAEETLKNIEEREESSNEQMKNELSTYDNHPADIGTEVYMAEQEKGFRSKLEDTIEEIDASLEDIKNGKYGYCDNCEKMISEERLEVLPYAKSCLGCPDKEVEDGKKEFETRDDERLGYRRNTSKETMGYDRDDAYRDALKDNIVPNDPSYSTGDNIGIADEREDSEITDEIEELSYEEDEDDLK